MTSAQPSARPRVVVSVLNWNGAETTLDCVRSVLASPHPGLDLRVVVVDNGSRADDRALLERGLAGSAAQLQRLPHNIGFAAGHNVVIREALNDGTDFVWLLNNDTLVPAGTLESLVGLMQQDPRCGATSPVIHALHDAGLMDFCGALHDWSALESRRPGLIDEARRLEAQMPAEMWLHGTALLLRMAAIEQSGVLDESYFAYYEDDDIGVRLSRAGWTNRVCFDARVQHSRHIAISGRRPAYFFYLMARNALLFWTRHASPAQRAGLRRRLVSRSLIEAAKLKAEALYEQADACLLGVAHGLSGTAGPPVLGGRPPAWLSIAARVPYRILKRCS